jgi:hypothetical protein
MNITHKSGNSLNALPVQVTRDGAAFSLSGKTLRYRLTAARDGTEVEIDFTVGATAALNVGVLTVTDAAQGLFTLTATSAAMTLDQGSYQGSLRITDAGDATYELELPDGTDPDDPATTDTWSILPEHQT